MIMALGLRPPFKHHPFCDVARGIDDRHSIVVAGVRTLIPCHADQRQLADLKDNGAQNVVDLRFDLVKVFDVELANQLHNQGVS